MTDIDNLELKKRSRRRLVGAAALALLAAIVLPMVMDDEPGVAVQDIQVTIPDRDADGALARPIASRPASVVEPAIAPAPLEQAPAAEQKSTPEVAATAGPDPSSVAPVEAPSAATERADGSAPARATAPPTAPPTAAAPRTAPPAPVTASPGPTPAPPRAPNDAEAARVRAILEGRQDVASAPAPRPSSAQQFVVQVGAFAEAEKADSLSSDLKTRGFVAYTERAGAVTRVRVGPFASRDEADRAAQRLGALGMNGVVTAR